ncbi:septin domain-containing protein [Sarocladium implicatum]|nr:septin domain-containing protein [Sarocladium implicatum]
MTLGLVNHIKARTRSVQIDKTTAFEAGMSPVEARSQSRASHRLSGLSIGDENRDPMASKSPVPPTVVRRYRSMLDIEEPPKLSPWKPMSFEELYSEPMQKSIDFEDHPVRTNGQPGEPRKKPADKAISRVRKSTTSPAPESASAVPPPSSPPEGKPVSPMESSEQEVPQSDTKDVVPTAAPSVSDNRNIVRRKLTGYVGFANLPNQWHRKSVRKGFNFNVMVVGESGLGKSTLVNTLFNTSLYPPKERKGPSLDIIPKTVTIQSISADIEEAGVRLRLTVVDTPGFGDFVNNDESWRPIVDNIEQRYDAYLDSENKVNRMNIVDNRIHACVFFIQPTGHSLKPLDIEVMRRLHTKVNLIPVIAKSDTLTDEEITSFKLRILSDIKYHGIQIFEGPRYELDDEETIAENNDIMSKVPFAVVGATNEIATADGRKVRGREYPWGIIEVDKEEHCDFVKLRQMLIRTHMEELKEHTNNMLYENYRTDKLLQMGVSQDPSVFKEVNPAVKQEEERALHEQKLAKMEAEMKMVFQQKVAEKESKLKQSEEELYARHREMKEQLDRQRMELEDKKQRIESGRPLEKEGKRKGFSLR